MVAFLNGCKANLYQRFSNILNFWCCSGSRQLSSCCNDYGFSYRSFTMTLVRKHFRWIALGLHRLQYTIYRCSSWSFRFDLALIRFGFSALGFIQPMKRRRGRGGNPDAFSFLSLSSLKWDGRELDKPSGLIKVYAYISSGEENTPRGTTDGQQLAAKFRAGEINCR